MTTRRGRILLNSGGGLHILAVDLLVDDTPATLADYYLTNAATEDDVEESAHYFVHTDIIGKERAPVWVRELTEQMKGI